MQVGLHIVEPDIDDTWSFISFSPSRGFPKTVVCPRFSI